jgi:hypothetical protein
MGVPTAIKAPPQGEIRLAATAVHADPLPIHRFQFRLDREDKHLDVGQGVPAVAAAGPGNASGRRRRSISGVQGIGARHGPNMVSLAPVVLLYAPEQPLQHGLILRTASN